MPTCRTSEARIIPAYAGSTHMSVMSFLTSLGSSPHTRGARPPTSTWSRRRGDHPRIRGEHKKGSPWAQAVTGIIPAYAGSTSARALMVMPSRGSSPHTRGALAGCTALPNLDRDHPRIRGEHLARVCVVGSVDGIIPAYAGSTGAARTSRTAPSGSSPHTRGAPDSAHTTSCSPRDHPRIRGEHQRH